MMISAKSRYALRVMVDLAQHNSGEFIPVKEIATRQGISLKYLESIMTILTKGKMLESASGKGGGYTAECTTLPFWQGLEAVINDYLEKHTLEDMISQKTHSCES